MLPKKIDILYLVWNKDNDVFFFFFVIINIIIIMNYIPIISILSMKRKLYIIK